MKLSPSVPPASRPCATVVSLGPVLLLLLLLPVALDAASPTLTLVNPRGGQRGNEVTIFLNGQRLSDAKEIFYYAGGITTTSLEVVNDKQVKVLVKIAPDCRLGEHALRLRTASGITELRTFYVGALPEVPEKEPNSEFKAPQKVPLNVTITGVIKNEDVDFFAFEARKGQRVSAEIEGMRLGSAIFDPSIAILNSARFELAAVDDVALLRQDAVATVVIPADGVYLVEVRESAYGGSNSSNYRLHLGTFPRPLATLPAGGKAGEEVEVRYLWDSPPGKGGEELRATIKLPPTPVSDFGIFARNADGIAPSPSVFRVSEFPNVLEVEPNDSREKATPAAVPRALNGVISPEGDVDHFRFHAKKGQTLDVHVYGRRIRSPLDSVLSIYGADGKRIATNDDSGGPDSYLRFKAPEDKDYIIRVTDHLGRGGPHYAYRIEVAPAKPSIFLQIPKVARYSQERQTIPVPRGNRYATVLQARRGNFGGELIIEPEGLPGGVTMHRPNMASNVDLIPVVFEAAADAPVAGTLSRLLARHVDEKRGISGEIRQVVELLYGRPNNSIYWTHSVDRAAVAVTTEVPFHIDIVEPKVPLVQRGNMELRVVARRQEGFTAPIAIQMIYNPPGVGSIRSRSIPKGKGEALIPLTANGKAAVGDWKIAVIGKANVPGGPVWVSTQLATLRIALPYVTVQLEKISQEQGKEIELFAKVEQRTAFEGKARVELLGLPPRVTAPSVEITRETAEFAFKLKIDPKSPVGLHKNLFCRVEITEKGEPIRLNAGYSELRIDRPLPPKKNEPPPAKKVAKKKESAKDSSPPPRRLTRLEKLRLEHKERQKVRTEETP